MSSSNYICIAFLLLKKECAVKQTHKHAQLTFTMSNDILNFPHQMSCISQSLILLYWTQFLFVLIKFYYQLR